MMIAVSVLALIISLDYLFFRGRGARFTAADGQTLCERVRAFDHQPCRYLLPKPE
jgi:hypothetical protein